MQFLRLSKGSIFIIILSRMAAKTNYIYWVNWKIQTVGNVGILFTASYLLMIIHHTEGSHYKSTWKFSYCKVKLPYISVTAAHWVVGSHTNLTWRMDLAAALLLQDISKSIFYSFFNILIWIMQSRLTSFLFSPMWLVFLEKCGQDWFCEIPEGLKILSL